MVFCGVLDEENFKKEISNLEVKIVKKYKLIRVSSHAIQEI
jgi:hypothetical protein